MSCDQATIALAMRGKPKDKGSAPSGAPDAERGRARRPVAGPNPTPRVRPSPPPPSAPTFAPSAKERTPSFAPPPTSPTFEAELSGKLKAFAQRWAGFSGTEQAGAQEFLQGLLEIYEVSFKPGTLFEQHPIRLQEPPRQTSLFGLEEPEPKAVKFTTERMDMYLPKVCVWEMKGPSEKLDKHHDQILGYWARTRTRFMVLCNFKEFWIYDTDDESGDGQLSPKVKLPLADLPSRGDVLLFLRGEKPDLEQSSVRVTAGIAKSLGRLVRELITASRNPDRDRERIAKFILECVFAMFAEDTDLVPPRIFTNAMREVLDSGKMDEVWSLFDDFSTRDSIRRVHRFAPYVNGPLFDPSNPKLALSPDQVQRLYDAANNFDWQGVRPEIFGSIFEQSLNLVERHELGAHFTHEEDIERVVGPTVIEPWQQRIAAIRSPKDAERVVAEMRAYHVLDPACGCGNFLYVVYREMKRLESALVDKWIAVHRAAAKRKADVRPPPARPYFSLTQVHGIEVNGFAAFLARVVMWIAEHLAARELGLDEHALPLKNLENQIKKDDALFVNWERPDGELAIVGNPPYMGVRKMRIDLGNDYVEDVFARYPDHNHAADYVTYWFAQALTTLRPGERAGFVCTDHVAQNEGRKASIDRVIAKGGTLTDAWRSYPWPGESAVHICIVNWIMAPYAGVKTLDGHEAATITPSLTESVDLTTIPRIDANKGMCFMGVTPGNMPFVLNDAERDEILASDPKSARVIRPYLIGRDVNRGVEQKPTRWIIDFAMMEEEEAAKFAGAMRHVRKYVYPQRKNNPREAYARNWWRFVEPRPGLRKAIDGLKEVLTITAVGPHLIITRHDADICFDHKLYVVAVGGMYHFGILQSATHERWVRGRPSMRETRLSYANTTQFETFPFPQAPDGTYDPRSVPGGVATARLVTAAQDFDRIRAEACRQRSLGLTKIHNLLREGMLPDLARAYEAMNDAVDACYGFPPGTWRNERETLHLLRQMNREVAEPVNIARRPQDARSRSINRS